MITQRPIRVGCLLICLALAGVTQADVPPPPTISFKQPPNPSWGHIEGTVKNRADGKPVAGAEISFIGSVFPGTSEVVKSDEKGAYRSPGLTPGGYRVLCKLGWSYYDYPSVVHVEDHKIVTVSCVLPPPRTPAPPPPQSAYDKWLPCKIVHNVRDANSELDLFINKGHEDQVRVGQEGIIMKADSDLPLEDGSFRIVKVLGPNQSVAHSPRSLPIAKNNRCRINHLPR